ncbi:hypothetical protein FRC00_007718, partial [Tulasnella sp. 408]
MSDLRRSSEDAIQSTCPTSSRQAQRIAMKQHRRSQSSSTVTTSSTITPSTVTRRHPLVSLPPDTSFDNDSDVSGPPSPPPSSDSARHSRRSASPEASTSTRTPSTSPPPRVRYSLTTPDRSISSVLESSRSWDTPQTPQTPGAGSSTAPSTSSPVARAKPRFKHSSSDTPLRKADSQPVQALPFPLTAMQDKYQQSGKVARVRFSDAHPRSMPKLSAATFSPPTPSRANTSPSLLLVPSTTPTSPTAESNSRSRSDSAKRRQSAQASTTAASAPNSGSWQRRVAEEMIRLSFANSNASNTSLSSAAKRNSRHSTGTRSSGEFQQAHLDPRLVKLNQPTAAPKVPPVPFPSTPGKEPTTGPHPKIRQKRSNTTPSPKKPPFESKGKENDVHRQHRLSSLIRNAAVAEPVEVRVVKQESFDHPEAAGINAQQWRLEVDVPNSSLGIPIAGHSSDDKGKAPETAEESPDKENDGDAEESEPNEPVLRPRPTERKVRRSIRSRNSSGARSLAAARSAGTSSTPDIAEGVIAPPTAARSGSLPSLNNRLNALRQSSQNTLQSPSTPPRTSTVSHPSSPDDSPTPSRRRLSSYAIEPSSLFFAPRATPPPVADPATMDSERMEDPAATAGPSSLPRSTTSAMAAPRPSSASIDQQSAVPSSSRPTSSYVTAPQSVISTPRPSHSTSRPPSLPESQTRTIEREEDVVSVGKGKGKRLFEDVEPGADAPLPSGNGSVEGGVGVVLGNGLVIPPRQRLESNLTRYTDDDTIGELPENPRKRLKLTSSAHIVQTLAEAAAAQSSPDSSYEHQPSPSEQAPRGILNKSPPPGEETGASRPSSRRSQSVSFTLQAGSTRDGARSPSLASTRGRRPLSVGSRPISPSQTSSRSIPLMAIISPRPASFVTAPPPSRNGYHQQYHLREPRRYSNASRPVSMQHAHHNSVPSTQQSPTSPHSMSYPQSMTANDHSPVRSAFSQQLATEERDGSGFPSLPFQGWAFFLGFILPFFWWIASFTRLDWDAYAVDAEAGAGPKHAPI